MIRHRSSYIVGTIVGIALPVATFAAFFGPTQSPPYGNVPGVVWNRPAADPNQAQPGAEYNVAGNARIGGDFYLSDSKALRIDSAGDSWLNVGNWLAGGFTMNVIGNLQTQSDGINDGRITAPKYCIAPNDCITAWPAGGGGGGDITDVLAGLGLTGGGSTGAVTLSLDTAYTDSKYVLRKGDTMTGLLTLSGDPTAPLEAATKQYVDNAVAGGGGGGDVTAVNQGTGITITTPNGPTPTVYFDTTYGDTRYVNTTGDTMTGNLTVNGGSNAITITSSAGSALLATGVTYGGGFSGAQAGVDSVGTINGIIGRTMNVGVGTAVRGYGGFVGGNLTGTETGVVAKGGTYGVRLEGTPTFGFYTTSSITNGVYAVGNTAGGYFENGTNSNYKTWVAYNGYGLYATVPLATDYGLYTNGKVQIGGDIVAGGNVLAGCTWTAYVADGSAMTCPAANPLMSGIQRSGTSMRMYCCDL